MRGGNNALGLRYYYGNEISTPVAVPTLQTFAYELDGVDHEEEESGRKNNLKKIIDEYTRPVFCESVGKPSDHIDNVKVLAVVTHRQVAPLFARNTVAQSCCTRLLMASTSNRWTIHRGPRLGFGGPLHA
jgi:O-acetylhomoserine/O-acetylserine sulfhydrylase-like pyridoxal-dependent enzyme